MIKSIMELDYVIFLCNNIVENNKFKNEYIKFELENTVNRDFELYYDKELIKLMVKVLQLGKNVEFVEGFQLGALISYVYNILNVNNGKKSIMNQREIVKRAKESQDSDVLKKISDYVFEDSFFLKFELDYEEKICSCFFTNILVFGDKRNNLAHDVEVDNLMLHFTGIKNYEIKGSINFAYIQSIRVFSCEYYKVNEETYRFIILCTANFEMVMFDITFSNVSTVKFEYNESSYQFNM